MITVNLIPGDIQRAMTRRRHLRRWSFSVAVSAAALLAAAGLNWAQQAKADALRAEDERLGLQLATARAELNAISAESNRILVQIQRADALRRKRPWSGMIALIASCMPGDCWLTSIATDPEKPAAGRVRRRPKRGAAAKDAVQPSVTIDAPRGMVIAGYAADAAHPHTFVANLRGTGVFKTVTLKSSQREPVYDGSYFRFELACGW